MSVFTEAALRNLNAVCAKSEGRDKLARFFQYAARAMLGFVALKQPKAGTSLLAIKEHAENLWKQLAAARRTHRWCKEFPVIQSIFQSLPLAISRPPSMSELVDRTLDLLQKVTMATFMVIDHIGWLKQVKLIAGGRRAGTGTIQMGLKFLSFSCFVGALHQLKKFADASSSAEKDNASRSSARKSLQTALRNGMMAVQTAHLSRWYETHDLVIGVLGMISSAMDVRAQLPAEAAPKKIESDEGAKKANLKSDGDVEKFSPDAKAMPRHSCEPRNVKNQL